MSEFTEEDRGALTMAAVFSFFAMVMCIGLMAMALISTAPDDADRLRRIEERWDAGKPPVEKQLTLQDLLERIEALEARDE